MDLEKILFVPSKSRYELEIEYYGNLQKARQHIRSNQIWKKIKEGHISQKKNLQKIIDVFGKENIVDRSDLNQDMIKEYDAFVFFGGDNHFTYCSQEILKYQSLNDGDKLVVGTVLDASKSFGGLLYFDVEKLLRSLDNLEKDNFYVEKWTTLEGVVNDRKDYFFPAVGDYFIGEYGRHLMSRNLVYLDGKEVFEEKSSGILVTTGAGAGFGSWYNTEHNLMFNKSNNFGKEEEIAKAVLTGNMSRAKIEFYKNQVLRIDSYNDTRGVIFPDSHDDHYAKFEMGTSVEIKLSKNKLSVVRIK